MRELYKRSLSMLIALMLVLSFAPVNGFAVETPNPVDPADVSQKDKVDINSCLNLDDSSNALAKTIDHTSNNNSSYQELQSQIILGSALTTQYYMDGADEAVKVSHNYDRNVKWSAVGVQFKVKDIIGENDYLKFSFKFDALEDSSLSQTMYIHNKGKDISASNWANSDVICLDASGKVRAYNELQAGQWYDLYIKITDKTGTPGQYYVVFYQTDYANAATHPDITAYVKNVGYVSNVPFSGIKPQIVLGSSLTTQYYMDGADEAVKVSHNYDRNAKWSAVGVQFKVKDNIGENDYLKFSFKFDALEDSSLSQTMYIHNKGKDISASNWAASDVICLDASGNAQAYNELQAGQWYDLYIKITDKTGTPGQYYVVFYQTDYANAATHPDITAYVKNVGYVSNVPFATLRSQITMGASVASQSSYSMDGTDEMVTVWHKNIDENGANAIHFNMDQFGAADYVKFMYKIDALSSDTAKRFLKVGIGTQNKITVWSGSSTYGTKESVEAYGLYIYDLTTGDTVRAQDMQADVWYEICMKIQKDENGNVQGSYSLATMQEGKDNIDAENRERITVHLKKVEYRSKLPFAELKSQITLGSSLTTQYYMDGADEAVKVSHNYDRNAKWSAVGVQFNVKDDIGGNDYLKFSFKFDALEDSTLSQSMYIFNKGKNIAAGNWANSGVICFDAAGNQRSYSELQSGQWYELQIEITDKTGTSGQYYVVFYQTDYANATSHPHITAYIKNVEYLVSDDRANDWTINSQFTLGSALTTQHYKDGTDEAVKVIHQASAANGTANVTFPVAQNIGDNTYLMFAYRFDAIQGASQVYDWNIQINNGEALSLYPLSNKGVADINAKGLYIYEADGVTPLPRFQNMRPGAWYTFYVQLRNNVQECTIACTQYNYSNYAEHPFVCSSLKKVQYVNALTESDVSEVTVDEVQYLEMECSPDYPEISADVESRYVTYYFSNSGNDNNSGLTEQVPLKTVAKANEIIAKAGQMPTKIAFKAGDEFACEYVANDPYKKGELYIFGHDAHAETPLIVTTYGETETAKYAKLYAADPSINGVPNEIVYIGESNTRVFNLELTGEKTKLGVQIFSDWGTETAKGGAMKNIVVSNCYIHDINVNYTQNPYAEIRTAYADALAKKAAGVFDYMPAPTTDFNDDKSSLDDVRTIVADEAFTYSTGGIRMATSSDTAKGPTWLENIWIEDNTIERVARCGMFLSTGWARRPGWDNGAGSYYYDEETGEEKGYYPSVNVVIRGNYLDYTGGDGIVLVNSRNSYVENNTSYHAQYLGRASSINGQAAYSVPIWIHSCTNVIMQHNEAGYCFMENGCADGQGFDIDIGNRSIIFRYNYSHHNAGGGLLITNRSTYDNVYDRDGNVIGQESRFIWVENITVQNNVFAYNGVRVFNIAGPTRNLNISNNTVLLDGQTRPAGSEIMLLQSEDMANTGTRARDWLFANNIFYQLETQPVIFDETFSDSCVVKNNVFYNFEDAFFDFGPASTHSAGTRFFNSSREDPALMTTCAEKGMESARQIVASAAYLRDFASYELTMQAMDLSRSVTEGLKYVGAFLNP